MTYARTLPAAVAGVGRHTWTAETAVLTTIMVTAAVLRAIASLLMGDAIVELPGVFDQVSYDTLARQILAGAGFTFPADWWPATRAGEPTAHWSFLYTSYLALVYGLAGEHPLVGRLVQAVLTGVLFPLFAWRLGKRLFSTEVGLVGAGLMAVYGYFIYYAAALVTESFFIVAVLWALDLATILATNVSTGRQSIRTWLLLGVALGSAALLRQAILLVVPFILAWLIWARLRRAAEIRLTIVGLLLAASVVTLMIVPFTVRNYLAFGRFVPLNTNAGFAFFWSNHPLQGTNFTVLLPNAMYAYLIPPELLALDEASLDSALMRRGMQFVLDDPGRYARLSLSRVRDYFQFWPSAESGPISNLTRVFSFGICLPFMLLGLVLAAVQRRDHALTGGDRVATLLLVGFAAAFSAVHILTWALIRYRLPVDAVLMPFAAVGLVETSRRVWIWRRVAWN